MLHNHHEALKGPTMHKEKPCVNGREPRGAQATNLTEHQPDEVAGEGTHGSGAEAGTIRKRSAVPHGS